MLVVSCLDLWFYLKLIKRTLQGFLEMAIYSFTKLRLFYRCPALGHLIGPPSPWCKQKYPDMGIYGHKFMQDKHDGFSFFFFFLKLFFWTLRVYFFFDSVSCCFYVLLFFVLSYKYDGWLMLVLILSILGSQCFLLLSSTWEIFFSTWAYSFALPIFKYQLYMSENTSGHKNQI